MKPAGIKAPHFSAPSSSGELVDSERFRGRHLVVYFYPRSFTFGGTRTTARFRDAAAELSALGADVVGVSPDAADVQREFARHYQATFPILADPDRKIAAAFDAIYPLLTRVMRVTFIVDPEGFIAARFHHELRYEKHVDYALAYMREVRAKS